MAHYTMPKARESVISNCCAAVLTLTLLIPSLIVALGLPWAVSTVTIPQFPEI